MDHHKETFDTWNKVAALYQEKFMHLEIYNSSYDFFIDAIPLPGARILEIGCGPGNITRYLLSKRPGFKITGIDIAPNMIALAQKNNPSAALEVMDCRDISRIPGRFHGIIAGFCIPYLSAAETEKLIADAYALLEDNGLLYLSFVEGNPESSGFKTGSSGHRSFFYYHALTTLRSQLAAHHFQEPVLFKVLYEKAAGENETHTITVARKRTPHSLP